MAFAKICHRTRPWLCGPVRCDVLPWSLWRATGMRGIDMTAWQNWKAIWAAVDIRSRRGWFRIWLLVATGWAIFAALHVDWPWQIKPETVASQTVRHGQKPADVLAQVQSEAALVCQPGSATINRTIEPEQPGSSNDPAVDQAIQSMLDEQKKRAGLSKESAPSIDDILNAAGEEQAKRAGLSKVSDPILDAANQYWDDDIRKRAGLAVTAVRAQQPDQAAQANILARKTGIPAETVRRNLPQVQQDHAARENVKALSDAPDWTKMWYKPPDSKPVAQ